MPPEVVPHRRSTTLSAAGILLALSALLGGCAGAPAPEDPFAAFVWSPPPDEARIRLVDIIRGRTDIEASSRMSAVMIDVSPKSRFDALVQPHGVAFDRQGRLLVTDPELDALLRFDRAGRRMDVMGTSGRTKLANPFGLDVGDDGTIYVADGGLQRIVAFDDEGNVVRLYGEPGELLNPTDVAVALEGERLFVADAKAHRIVVFDLSEGAILDSFGAQGEGEGSFNFPTALTFNPDGELLVVDQLNARVQILTESGEYLDEFGGRGVSFGHFVRPKDVAVDSFGFIYVTDAAFSNIQLFDADLQLLTFVGGGGEGPGQFKNASGIAARGDEFAVVDQLNRRFQVFRYLSPRGGD